MAEIYGLYSSRDYRVRYVGETLRGYANRFEEHKRSPSPKLAIWFHDEWRAGYLIECVKLYECDDELRTQVERWWMGRFPGLLNKRMSGQTWLTAHCGHPLPKISEIYAHRRRYIYNVGGFCGVRYNIHWDCYQVLVYTGSVAGWLSGDGMPGWEDGDSYFSDRTRAVLARDKYRQGRPVNWLPDVQLEI